MLTAEGCKARRERLWRSLPEGCAWLLIADPRHVQYLSGFWIDPLSSSAGERGLLLLERDGEAVLLCDDYALASADGRPFVDRILAESWYDQRRPPPDRDRLLFQGLRRLSGRLRLGRGLVESGWLPLEAWEVVSAAAAGPWSLSLSALLRELRRVKEADELELMRRCIRAGEAGQRRGRRAAAAGVGEWELYREVQSAALAELGAPALVYGDFRAATPSLPRAGGPPTDYVLRPGDAFILDFSVVLAGYRCDLTSTVVAGEPGRELRELHALCLAALQAGEGELRAGARARRVYEAVRAPLAGRPGLFPHHAGHGLGLGHPEAPAFVPESEEVLNAGEVVTLEPGAYLEGVGGVRLEHNYLITGDGCERLSRHETGLTVEPS